MVDKVLYSDIVDAETDGENAARLINDSKRAVNEVVEIANGLGTSSTKNVGTSSDEVPTNSDLGEAAYKNMATGGETVVGTANKIPDSQAVKYAIDQLAPALSLNYYTPSTNVTTTSNIGEVVVHKVATPTISTSNISVTFGAGMPGTSGVVDTLNMGYTLTSDVVMTGALFLNDINNDEARGYPIMATGEIGDTSLSLFRTDATSTISNPLPGVSYNSDDFYINIQLHGIGFTSEL